MITPIFMLVEPGRVKGRWLDTGLARPLSMALDMTCFALLTSSSDDATSASCGWPVSPLNVCNRFCWQLSSPRPNTPFLLMIFWCHRCVETDVFPVVFLDVIFHGIMIFWHFIPTLRGHIDGFLPWMKKLFLDQSAPVGERHLSYKWLYEIALVACWHAFCLCVRVVGPFWFATFDSKICIKSGSSDMLTSILTAQWSHKVRAKVLDRNIFFINFQTMRLLWKVSLHFDCAGSYKKCVSVLGLRTLPAHGLLCKTSYMVLLNIILFLTLESSSSTSPSTSSSATSLHCTSASSKSSSPTSSSSDHLPAPIHLQH